MQRKLTVCSIAAVVLATLLAGITAQAGQYKLALNHCTSLESPWHKASVAFADYINERIGDRYKIEVYGNGALVQANWKVMFEMTQSGAAHLGIEATATLSSLVDEVGALNLPFLFDDKEHVQRFVDARCPSWVKWFYNALEEQNLVVLAETPRNFRQLSNNRHTIRTPEDIAGLRFRVPGSALFIDIFEALGAKPVPLPGGEIYTGIQLGTVVGQDNSITNQYDFKTYEVAKYFTVWNYVADTSALFMNKELWDTISPEDQAVFQEASKLWTEVNVQEDLKQMEVAMENMTKAGCEFYYMTAEEKVPFKKMLEPVYAKFAASVDENDMKVYLDYIEKTRQ